MIERRLEIDWLKGCAILFVLFMHSIDSKILYGIHQELYVGQAVPIFILVSFYLSFTFCSSETNYIGKWYNKQRLLKLFKRVLLPFLIVWSIQIISALIYRFVSGDNVLLINTLKRGGGRGPGAYYVWVYLQIWFLAPFLYYILNKGKYKGIILILLICILLNVLCSVIDPPSTLYSKLCIRYLFLSAVAWILFKKEYNRYMCLLLGILSIVYLEFFRHLNLTPFIYNGEWHTQQYPVYFYTLVFVSFLISLWRFISRYINCGFIYWLGKNSWEIFLLQMLIISFVSLPRFNISNIYSLNQILYMVFVFVFAIVPVVFYRKIIHD